jgi:hypothetical protein
MEGAGQEGARANNYLETIAKTALIVKKKHDCRGKLK